MNNENELKFICPHCKNHRLEEVMSNVTVASEIRINSNGDHDYVEQTNEGGEVAQYQCIHCGYIVGENWGYPIIDCVELVKWVKENCPQG